MLNKSDAASLWKPLLEPATVAGLSLQNRFALAPLTRLQCPGGIPTEKVMAFYKRRAAQLGLIITEGTYVDQPSAGRSQNVPRLDSPEALAGWGQVVDSVHSKGAKIFPQLWHVGGVRKPGDGPFPDAPVLTPSGIDLDHNVVGEPADQRDIDEVIEAFAAGAVAAKGVGFDGVEIHGANGYLLDQFLWEETNHRSDSYGGSIPNRVRLSAEVVSEIRRRVGPEFSIQFRFGQWKLGHFAAQVALTPAELEQILIPLTEAGVDIFHPSTRRFWEPAFDGSDLTLAGWSKKITDRPAVAVGYVGVDRAFRAGDEEPAEQYDPHRLLELFAEKQYDILAIGRALLADPEWVAKTTQGFETEIVSYTKQSEATYY